MKSNASYAGLLIGIFIISFAIPLTFAAKVSGIFSGDTDYIDDKVFPSAFNVFAPDRTLEVLNSSELNPSDKSDFLISIWFQIKRLPRDGERAIFLSKYDGDTKNKPGYAVAVARSGDSLRPQVYWRGLSGAGNWRTFSEIDVIPGQWYRLLISFYDGQYLGMQGYAYSNEASTKPTLLGGFELEEALEVKSNSNIFLGSLGSKNYRGRIGPVAIILLDDLKDKFEDVWSILSGEDAYSAWDREKIALWIEDSLDRGRSAYKLKIQGGKNGKKSGKKKTK